VITRVFDLSFRHKIPLWGAALIIVSTLSVSAILMARAYGDLREAILASANGLGHTLAQTVIPSLLHDDVWRAFEIVRSPFHRDEVRSPVEPEGALVVDTEQRIFVSSHPDRYPLLRELATVSQDFAALAATIAPKDLRDMVVVEPKGSRYALVGIPIVDGGARLGTLVLIYSRDGLLLKFGKAAFGSALFGLIVLAVLLPVNWYWGQRMARPLVQLAARMDNIRDCPPEHMEPGIYAYRDELGRLFEAYNRMVAALDEKRQLERAMVSSERLAAIGRLTAGVAHEINNPLAGMLTAIDTLKLRGGLDERSLRTLGLVERGLLQVRDTVAALLVEARPQERRLEPRDVRDVYTLIQPMATKHGVQLEFEVLLDKPVLVPAGPIRQVLMNLLNNALQAATSDAAGWVRATVSAGDGMLEIMVVNNGTPLASHQLERLFEPFVSFREGGHGLGLWVTYQLIEQLHGKVQASCCGDTVTFTVRVPLEVHEAAVA
jgi:signal transduction histidine kinase